MSSSSGAKRSGDAVKVARSTKAEEVVRSRKASCRLRGSMPHRAVRTIPALNPETGLKVCFCCGEA